MRLDDVGDNSLSGTSASGTAPDISSSRPTPGASGSRVADTAPDGPSTAVGKGMSGAARVGFGAVALVINGGKSAGRSLMSMARGLMAMASSGGTALSSAMGGAISAQAGAKLVGGGAVGSVVMGLVMLGMMFSVPSPAKFGADDPACEIRESDVNTSQGPGGDMEENAKQVYGILAGLGMPDENIAGILGNFETESGIDPAGVETVPTNQERNKPGPIKTRIEKANFAGSAGLKPLSVEHLGIGLGQWTNGRGVGLRDFADSTNKDWYNMEVQMAYAISADSGAHIYKDMIAGTSPGSDNPGDAANYYLRHWEIPDGMDQQEPIRRKQASQWYAKMGGWSADESAAKSVLELAKTEVKAANRKSFQAQLLECDQDGSNNGGNADAAIAFATYAWPLQDMSKGNDGTHIYIWLHDEILKGDPYYASCDRSVGVAVKWSGTDDSFEVAGTSLQYQYLTTETEKWERIDGWDKSKGTDMLKPGDILVTTSSGHITMYLGEEAVEEVWGTTEYADKMEGFDFGDGSLNGRAPGLTKYYLDVGDDRNYEAFRSRKVETDPQYKELSPPSDLKPATGPQRHTTPPP